MPNDKQPLLPAWPRACKEPLFAGRIKLSCDDFIVTELPGFARSGTGEHDYLWIEKTGANTAWVADALARHAGVRRGDVGYAGLKDRQAITRQWFSVRRPTGQGTDWSTFAAAGVCILAVERHMRKLRRGAHAGNEFDIVVRGATDSGDAIAARLDTISRRGVPNYFGAQRFGREGSNLRDAQRLFRGRRLSRDRRGLALSAARAFIFNEILATRVSDGSWEQALPGEALNLEGSGSFFVAAEIDEAMRARVVSMDVHPTGALWGRGEPIAAGRPASIESAIAAANRAFAHGLEQHGLQMDRRALRLVVHDLGWHIGDDALRLQFRLNRGSYATSVLREIAGGIDD